MKIENYILEGRLTNQNHNRDPLKQVERSLSSISVCAEGDDAGQSWFSCFVNSFVSWAVWFKEFICCCRESTRYIPDVSNLYFVIWESLNQKLQEANFNELPDNAIAMIQISVLDHEYEMVFERGKNLGKKLENFLRAHYPKAERSREGYIPFVIRWHFLSATMGVNSQSLEWKKGGRLYEAYQDGSGLPKSTQKSDLSKELNVKIEIPFAGNSKQAAWCDQMAQKLPSFENIDRLKNINPKDFFVPHETFSHFNILGFKGAILEALENSAIKI